MSNYKSKKWLENKYYHERLTLREMASLANCCQRTIVNWMNKFNLPRRSSVDTLYGFRQYIDKNWLHDRYWKDGMTQKEIADISNVNQYVIWKYMKRLGVPIRKRFNASYDLNADLFREWTHDSAYILGLLATDGSIDKREKCITFKSADRELTEFIHRILGIDPNRPIFEDQYTPGQIYYRVLISSKDIVLDLKKLGITYAKTTTLSWPNVPQTFLSSFISGVLDGDGHIGFRKSRNCLKVVISMSAKEFMDKLIESIRQSIDIIGSYYHVSPAKPHWNIMYRFQIEGKGAIPLLNWIYSAPCPHLSRKKKIFIDYLHFNDLPLAHKFPNQILGGPN